MFKCFTKTRVGRTAGWLLPVLLAVLGPLLVPGLAARAQVSPPGPVNGMSNLAGLLVASNFGQWQVPRGNLGQYSWNKPVFCQPTEGGTIFNAFTVGTPVTIIDEVAPFNDEIVVPTSVTITPNSCSIDVAPVHGHNQYHFTSATAGLQEAINWAGTTTYQVIITPNWTQLGGQTSMITSAQGNASVTILDQRSSVILPYLYESGAYVAAPFGGTAANPAGPAFAVNFANSAVDAFQGDGLAASVNPITHFLLSQNMCTALSPSINVKCYGAKGDGRSGAASYTAGSSIVTVPSANFVNASLADGGDIGKIGYELNAGDSGTHVTITACNVTAGLATFTATNSFRGTEKLVVNTGFTGGCIDFKNVLLNVGTNGLSSTQFTVTTAHANLSTQTDTGTAIQTLDLRGQIATVIDATHITMSAVAGFSASMLPAVTVSSTDPAPSNVIWATDDAASIQAALDAAANTTFFPRGAVGQRIPEVLFPTGDYHYATGLVKDRGQLKGVRGAAGVRLFYDGQDGAGPAWYEPVVAGLGGNESNDGIEYHIDSIYFLPTWQWVIDPSVDYSFSWTNNVFSGGSQGLVKLTAGCINCKFENNRWDTWGGAGLYVTVSASGARDALDLESNTMDTGGAIEVARNLQVDSYLTIDNTAGRPDSLGVVTIRGARRWEDQAVTSMSGSKPAIVKFVTGGNAAGVATPSILWDSLSINLLQNQNVALMSMDDSAAPGQSCPIFLLENIDRNIPLFSDYETTSGLWCGRGGTGTPIAHAPAFADGGFHINFYPSPTIFDPGMIPWFGIAAKNRAPDSEFQQSIWTVGTGYTACDHCGVGGSAGYTYSGTGSPSGFNHITSPLVAVTTGELYYFTGGVDCSNVPSGFAVGFLLEDQSGSPLAATPIGNCTSGVNGNKGQAKFITIPGGVTGLFMVVTLGNVTVPSGQLVTFSRPQLNISSTPQPYLPSSSATAGPPTCTTNQLLYYATSGAVPVCLTLGTNLAIAAGVINASATGATNFNALTSGTNNGAAMLVGTGASLGPTGSGTIAATSAPFTGLTGNLGTTQGPTSLTGLLKDTAGTLSAATAGTDYLTPTGSAVGLSKASAVAFGVSECDGITITCSGGIFVAVGGGSSGISGLTLGFVPLAGSATTLTANSPIDYNITNAGFLTSTKPWIISDTIDPGFMGLLPNGVAAAVTAGAAGWGIAATLTTAGNYLMPDAPGTGFWFGSNAAGVVTDTFIGSTGTGNVVLATSPTLVTPALGTPSALVLTNATGLPNASVIGLGTAALQNTGTSGANLGFLNGVNTYSGASIFSAVGAASTPGLSITGAPFAGTGTTSTPQLYLNCSGSTQPATWSTATTFLGVNACSGFAGNFIDVHANGGGSIFSISSGGVVTTTSGIVASGTIRTAATAGFVFGASSDANFSRDSAGVIDCGNGTAANKTCTLNVATLNATGAVSANTLAGAIVIATGSITVSGCSLTSAAGGRAAGQFLSGTTGSCTVVITPGITATNGFFCRANDLTTTADTVIQTASTTTTATISGTTVSGDLINFGCTAY